MGLFARKVAAWLRLPHYLYLWLLPVLFVLTPGCSREQEALLGTAWFAKPTRVYSGSPVRGRSFTIGVSLPRNGVFPEGLGAGMQAAAARNQVHLDLRRHVSGAEQDQQMASLCAAKPDALLSWCPSATAARRIVNAVDQAGIPVFTLGTATDAGRVTAHFALATPMLAEDDAAKAGEQIIDRVAAYLRGEKLKPYYTIPTRGGLPAH